MPHWRCFWLGRNSFVSNLALLLGNLAPRCAAQLIYRYIVHDGSDNDSRQTERRRQISADPGLRAEMFVDLRTKGTRQSRCRGLSHRPSARAVWVRGVSAGRLVPRAHEGELANTSTLSRKCVYTLQRRRMAPILPFCSVQSVSRCLEHVALCCFKVETQIRNMLQALLSCIL